jgi:hypothetical protein
VRLDEYGQWGLRKEVVSSNYFILLCKLDAALLYLAIIAGSVSNNLILCFAKEA